MTATTQEKRGKEGTTISDELYDILVRTYNRLEEAERRLAKLRRRSAKLRRKTEHAEALVAYLDSEAKKLADRVTLGL